MPVAIALLANALPSVATAAENTLKLFFKNRFDRGADVRAKTILNRIVALLKGRSRLTISLSEDSLERLEELKDYTDAETTTDVLRSSLRLAYLIMTAEKRGVRVEARDLEDPEARPGIINIFGTITPG